MTNLQKQIQDYIRDQLPKGRLSERTLAAHLNGTRAQAREMLLALEGTGVLRRQPQSGYSVVEYSADDVDIARYLRYFIEHEAAQISMGRNITVKERAAIEKILAEQDEAAKNRDFLRFAELETTFHTALVELSHDNLLIHLFNYVQLVAFAINCEAEKYYSAHEKDAEWNYQEARRQHHALFEGICAGKSAEVFKLLDTHFHAEDLAQWLNRHFQQSELGKGTASRRGRPANWSPSQLEHVRQSATRVSLDTPGMDALVLQLQTIHGLTGEEIAKLFQVSPRTIARFIHDCREKHDTPKTP